MAHSGDRDLSWVDPPEADILQRVGIIPLFVLGGARLGTANLFSIGRCQEGNACTSDVSGPSKGPMILGSSQVKV